MPLRIKAIACFSVVVLSSTLMPTAAQMGGNEYDEAAAALAKRYLEEGRQTFRFDTFGSEDFWGGKLKLHEAIAGEKLGGAGPGLAPAKSS